MGPGRPRYAVGPLTPLRLAWPGLIDAKSHNEKGPPLRWAFRFDGAGTRNRTRDLLITSQLLYLLSYTGEVPRIIPAGAGE